MSQSFNPENYSKYLEREFNYNVNYIDIAELNNIIFNHSHTTVESTLQEIVEYLDDIEMQHFDTSEYKNPIPLSQLLKSLGKGDTTFTILPYTDDDNTDREFTKSGQNYNDTRDYTKLDEIEKISDNQLEDLLKSQGYQLSDLTNPLMVEQNHFLKEILEEINNYNGQTSVFAIIGYTDLLSVIANREFPIYVSGKLGLIDTVLGDGSIFETTIDAPIKIEPIEHNSMMSLDSDTDKFSRFGFSYTGIYGDYPDFLEVSYSNPQAKKLKGHQLVLDLGI